MFVFVPHSAAASAPSPTALPTAVPVPPGPAPPMAYAAPPHHQAVSAHATQVPQAPVPPPGAVPPTIQVHGQTYVYVAPGHTGPMASAAPPAASVGPYHLPSVPAPGPVQAQHAHTTKPPAAMYYVPPPPAPQAHAPPPLPQHLQMQEIAEGPPQHYAPPVPVPQPPAPVDASVAADHGWDGRHPEGGQQYHRRGNGRFDAAPVAVGRGPIAAPHSSHLDLLARGKLTPVSESLKDVLGRPIEEVDPKAVLRRSRTLRKKIRVAWYHLTRPPQEVSPAERVKASRLPEFEAALAQLDETARRLGVLPLTEEAVLQEGARLMLLAKEDLEAFCRTTSQTSAGPPSHRSSDADAIDSVEGSGGGRCPALLDGEEEGDGDDDGDADADPQVAVYRKFAQSAAYHAVKMRRLHAHIAAGRSAGGFLKRNNSQ